MKKMKKIVLAVMAAILIMQPVQAKGINDTISKVGIDRFAHAGMSYVIADQLHRHAGMNKFWAGFTTVCIGAAKEQYVDDHFDAGDFAADMAGIVVFSW